MDLNSFGSYPAAVTLVKIILEQDDPQAASKKIGMMFGEFGEALKAIKKVEDLHIARFFFNRTVEFYVKRITDVLGDGSLATHTLNVFAYRRRKFWKEFLANKRNG